MSHNEFREVTRQRPCPICGRPKWCGVSSDGTAVICMRIESGKPTQNDGWLHVIGKSDYRLRPRSFPVRPGQSLTDDVAALARQYERAMTAETYTTASRSLGVSAESLRRLHVGTDGRALTFPMKNARGRIVGIRRRFPSGQKLSLKGSHNGLFIPDDLTGTDPLLVVEGNTDCAAGPDLGFDTIGRPSCRGLEAETIRDLPRPARSHYRGQ